MTRRRCTAWTSSAALGAFIGLLGCAEAEPDPTDPGAQEPPEAEPEPECLIEEAPDYALPVQPMPRLPVAGLWEGVFVSEAGEAYEVSVVVDDEELPSGMPFAGHPPSWIIRSMQGTIDGWFDIDGIFLICVGSGNRPCYSNAPHYAPRIVRQGEGLLKADAVNESCSNWAGNGFGNWLPVHSEVALNEAGDRLGGWTQVAVGCYHLLPEGQGWVNGTLELDYLGEGR